MDRLIVNSVIRLSVRSLGCSLNSLKFPFVGSFHFGFVQLFRPLLRLLIHGHKQVINNKI